LLHQVGRYGCVASIHAGFSRVARSPDIAAHAKQSRADSPHAIACMFDLRQGNGESDRAAGM
jgi:hypothetical protein